MCVNSRSFRFAHMSRSLGGTALSNTKFPWKSLRKKKKMNTTDHKNRCMGKCSLDFLDRLIPPWNTLGYPPIPNVTLRAIIRRSGVIEPSRHTSPRIRPSARQRRIAPQQRYIAGVLVIMLVLKVVSRSLVWRRGANDGGRRAWGLESWRLNWGVRRTWGVYVRLRGRCRVEILRRRVEWVR